MKISITNLNRITILLLVILMPAFSFAQTDPGGDPDVPIDGGLSLLLAAGVGYVAKKGYEARKKHKTQQ
jgi:hypothetical protein